MLTYAELDVLVAQAAQELGAPRRLVCLPMSNTVECIVAYLAALRGGHVALLVPPCTSAQISAPYAPDSELRDGRFVHLHDRPRHDLHPDLAVLLSTSGSTGSPKLVRISTGALDANAAAIATSLGIDADDCAITTLSPAYSYGLSVLNSHLLVGARMVLNEHSVTTPEFWALVREAGVTGIATVPYSLQLIERSADADLAAPSLRRITCAGGRVDPVTAERWARLGRENGWELAIMYGQTEATARIACHRGDSVLAHPGAVGTPVHGGELRIEAPDEHGVGEVVYRGPNVMLGYAEGPEDLALGRTIDELHTGDLGCIDAEGNLEIHGRRSRIAKVRGLRIPLQEVDDRLASAGIAAASVALDDVIGVVSPEPPQRVRTLLTGHLRLPHSAIRVARADVPRLANGKVDAAAMAVLLGSSTDEAHPAVGAEQRLMSAYGAALGGRAGRDDTFISLGGDSLSYVELSLQIETVLGHLPPGWERMSIAELSRLAALSTVEPSGPRQIARRQLDTSVLVRAIAIVLVVGSHAQAFDLRGGAHVLLALIGFNLARFHGGRPLGRERITAMARSVGAITVPSLAFIAVLAWLTDEYRWQVLGWNWIVNPGELTAEWRYWFIESVVWLVPAMLLATCAGPVHRSLQRWPVAAPLGIAVVLATAGHVWGPSAFPASLFSPVAVAWMLALGWAIAGASTARQRLAVSAVSVAASALLYSGTREWVFPIGVLALLWLPRVRLPAPAAWAAVLLAQASLLIYLAQWPVLGQIRGWPALVIACVLCIAAMRAWRWSTARVATRWSVRQPLPPCRPQLPSPTLPTLSPTP